MKKVQIDPATQRRPTSRKQNRSARIKEQLTQQVEVQVIPAKADMEGYERPKPRVCAYCRVSTDMDTQALSYELQVQNYTEYITSKGDKKQYFIEGHHEAIIDKDDWLLVQKLIRERHYCKNRRRRRPRIMIKGCLAGFALIDLEWDDDDIESIFTTPKTNTQEAGTSENIEIIEIKGE